MLRHDCQDADFGLMQEDGAKLLEAIPALRAAGFELLARYIDNRGVAVEYAFQKDGARFDFFLHEPAEDGKIRYSFFGISPSPVEARPIEMVAELPRYDLGPFEFLGREWRKPADHESFLAAEYGDWRTPRPGFDHRSDSPSVILINRWENSARTRFEP